MQSILEELYMGNIGFDSGYYPQNSPFAQAAKRKLDRMEKLTALLDDTGNALFEQYCDAQEELDAIVRYNTYADALRFGILLMMEVLPGACPGAETGGN